MNDKPDIGVRIATAVNELDIDFSRLTFAGWLVSLLSFVAGGGVAYLACRAMIQRNGLDLAAGMVFCVTMIAVTTVTFLTARWTLGLAGLAVTKPTSAPVDGHDANRERDHEYRANARGDRRTVQRARGRLGRATGKLTKSGLRTSRGMTAPASSQPAAS